MSIDHSWDDYLMFRIKNDKQYYFEKGRIEAADAIYGDLPDGAYWAVCEETGVGQDLQLAVDVYEKENKLGVHAPKHLNSRLEGIKDECIYRS